MNNKEIDEKVEKLKHIIFDNYSRTQEEREKALKDYADIYYNWGYSIGSHEDCNRNSDY